MRQRVLQWVAIGIFLLVGFSLGGASVVNVDNRPQFSYWAVPALLCFVLALFAAHQRPNSS